MYKIKYVATVEINAEIDDEAVGMLSFEKAKERIAEKHTLTEWLEETIREEILIDQDDARVDGDCNVTELQVEVWQEKE